MCPITGGLFHPFSPFSLSLVCRAIKVWAGFRVGYRGRYCIRAVLSPSFHPPGGIHSHTLRSIYLKQMLSDAAPLCGGKMRPEPPSLRPLCSFPVPLTRGDAPFPLFSLRVSPPYSLSPLPLEQGCFLRHPSASCSLHPTVSSWTRSRYRFPFALTKVEGVADTDPKLDRAEC